MNRRFRAHLWILGGPGSLLAALVLLIIHSSSYIGRPAWTFGLSISILIACFVTYLTFKEILERETLLDALKAEKESQALSMRSTLDEASHIYREKVEKLEESIAGLEKDHSELQVGYEQIHDACQNEKGKASALFTSLQDALDALRLVRQFHYFQDQQSALLPTDLPSKHKQLREQFDEKALVLDQTRRRLFALEGQLFLTRREGAEEKLGPQEELQMIQTDLAFLDEENQRLEREIEHLEHLVSELLKPKEKKKTSSKKKVEQMLELQFDATKKPSLN